MSYGKMVTIANLANFQLGAALLGDAVPEGATTVWLEGVSRILRRQLVLPPNGEKKVGETMEFLNTQMEKDGYILHCGIQVNKTWKRNERFLATQAHWRIQKSSGRLNPWINRGDPISVAGGLSALLEDYSTYVDNKFTKKDILLAKDGLEKVRDFIGTLSELNGAEGFALDSEGEVLAVISRWPQFTKYAMNGPLAHLNPRPAETESISDEVAPF